MIDHEKKKTLITNDTRMGEAEHRTLIEDSGIIVTPEKLKELAKLARERKLEFDVVACAGMSYQRALRIRELRSKLSWRGVALETYAEWGADALWEPPTNQLAGMALCEAAAHVLQEDPHKFPWQAMQ